MLCIVRYKNGIGLKNHELAYRCILNADEGDDYLFSSGRRHTDTPVNMQACMTELTPEALNKSKILQKVFERDKDALYALMQPLNLQEQQVTRTFSDMSASYV